MGKKKAKAKPATEPKAAKEHKFRFLVGDTTDGPIAFEAVVRAEDAELATAFLRSALPEELPLYIHDDRVEKFILKLNWSVVTKHQIVK